MADFLGTDSEANFEHLVEAYLDAHPWSTVVQIRDGLYQQTGVRYERIQGRLDRIERRRFLYRRPGVGVTREYMLGPVRTEPRRKAFGLEAVGWLGEGVEVWAHGADVVDPAVVAVVEAIRAEVEAMITTRLVPLLAPVPTAPPVVDEPEPEDQDSPEWFVWLMRKVA